MNKTLRILKLTLLISFISIGMARSQTKTVRKIQKDREWSHYQKTWYQLEISKLKDIKLDIRKSDKAGKKQPKRAEKLARLRNDISEMARKEGGYE
jgi:hypothetical protein